MTITTTDPTDLLQRAAAGHRDAWSELIRRYTPLLRSRAARWRLQEADVHDVMQTTWLRLAEHLDRIHTPEHLAGWLATVVTRECQRMGRERGRAVPAEDVGARTAASEPGPEQQTVDEDTAKLLRTAIGGLPPRRQDLLLALFQPERRPYSEIARDLGVPIGSLGPTRARTLLELRRVLEVAGISG